MIKIGGFNTHCFAAVVTALLSFAAPAWAGDGGDDSGAFQAALDNVCNLLGVNTASCKVPTLTQVVLEVASLQNTSPDFVRGPLGNFNVSPTAFGGLCDVVASAGGNALPACSQAAVNAVNPPAPSPVEPSDLSSLTPMAFVGGKGQAVPVPLGTSTANSFLYAVATGPNGEPDTLTLFLDYPGQTNTNVQNNQIFAKISLPLQLLSSGIERLICGATGCPSSVATLQVSGCQSCTNKLSATVIGDFSVAGQITNPSASALNIQVAAQFGSSPNSASRHLILEVQVPLLVTHGTDPAYFGISGATPVNALSGLPTAFTTDLIPTSSIGITPQAAPTCSAFPNGCPSSPSPLPTTTFPLCASISGGSGPLGSSQFRSAAATFLSIGTDGATYISSPVPPLQSSLQCPF